MTRGTNSLANVQKMSHFSRQPMDKGATEDTRKSSNSRLVHNGSSWSMIAAHEIQDEENLVHKQNKEDEIRDNLVLSKQCTMNTAILTWALHPRSGIDEIDVMSKTVITVISGTLDNRRSYKKGDNRSVGVL